ncbi:MAG TPA: lytic transglycosylase domain-containing protein [Xanthobacteraceae bacterium]
MAVEVGTPIGSPRAATAVTGAIRGAAQATGTSFNYLLATAKIESDLDPNVTMKSSSATGLFQFIDQTWLGTLKQAGPAFGYGAYANAISRNATTGHYSVDDPEMRREIMKLRYDPSANAVMAGVLTQKNAAALTRHIGRAPTEGELYIAHFLGAGGAGKLIDLVGSDPGTSAATVFPLAAHANRPIFYDRGGNARSVSGVYSEIVRRYRVASDGTATMVASAAARPLAKAASRVTDVAAVTNAFAVAAAAPPAASAAPAAAPSATTFNSLFRDQDRRAAVDPVVAALWSVPADASAPDARPAPLQGASGVTDTAGASSLDLFRDQRPNTRALFGGSL